MITAINKYETLRKSIWCDCKCRFDGRNSSSNQKRNKDKCRGECKYSIKDCVCKEYYVWNPATCAFDINYPYEI